MKGYRAPQAELEAQWTLKQRWTFTGEVFRRVLGEMIRICSEKFWFTSKSFNNFGLVGMMTAVKGNKEKETVRYKIELLTENWITFL